MHRLEHLPRLLDRVIHNEYQDKIFWDSLIDGDESQPVCAIVSGVMLNSIPHALSLQNDQTLDQPCVVVAPCEL